MAAGQEKEQAEEALAHQTRASEQRSSALLAAQRSTMQGERERVNAQLQQCQDMLDKYQAFLAAQQHKWTRLTASNKQPVTSEARRLSSAAQREASDVEVSSGSAIFVKRGDQPSRNNARDDGSGSSVTNQMAKQNIPELSGVVTDEFGRFDETTADSHRLVSRPYLPLVPGAHSSQYDAQMPNTVQIHTSCSAGTESSHTKFLAATLRSVG